jgi:hypothetical protein
MPPTRSCEDAAKVLKECLSKTSCYQSGQYTMAECLKKTDECRAYQVAFTLCVKGQIDMRSRIQGNKAA